MVRAGAYALSGVAKGAGLVQSGDETAAGGLHGSLPASEERWLKRQWP